MKTALLLKTFPIIFCFIFILTCTVVSVNKSYAEILRGFEAHKAYIYPVVRISTHYGTGSGTLVYSKTENDDDSYSTYVLTNYHVIESAISITEDWDSNLKRNVTHERRSIVYVEIFKYRDVSVPVGTMKIESDIIIYNKLEDMALLKIRYDESIEYIAKLAPSEPEYMVMDRSIAVGCSLGWPTLPAVGEITRLRYQIQSLPYDMSSAQIIFGNSGGAMFLEDGTFIGIPSRVAMAGWSGAITHMGLFIPAFRIYKWLETEHYDFIYKPDLIEKE